MFPFESHRGWPGWSAWALKARLRERGDVRLAAKQWLVEDTGSLMLAAVCVPPRGDECDETARVIG